MIYLDSSVALAHILAENRFPPDSLWYEDIVSSKLLEYEVWTRLHRERVGPSNYDATRKLLGQIELVSLTPPVLARALEPFPVPVRTLDALHLATLVFLQNQDKRIMLATYDDRLVAAARALGIGIAEDML